MLGQVREQPNGFSTCHGRVTQSLVAGPIIVLYFVGIGLAKLVEGNPLFARD